MGSSKGTFIDTARKSSLTENSKLIKFKSSEGIRSQCRAAVTDVCKISKICEAISSLVFNKSLSTSALLLDKFFKILFSAVSTDFR